MNRWTRENEIERAKRKSERELKTVEDAIVLLNLLLEKQNIRVPQMKRFASNLKGIKEIERKNEKLLKRLKKSER
jgi:hypothetical protein